MSNYTKTTAFGVKDVLATGDPDKKILGAAFDTEFDAIAVAVATKANSFTRTLLIATRTGTDQVLVNASNTNLIFNNEVIDSANAYNNANGTFTVPYTGYYRFSLCASITGTTITTSSYVQIYNGATRLGYSGLFILSGSAAATCVLTVDASLTVGDAIVLPAVVNATAPLLGIGSSFSVQRIET